MCADSGKLQRCDQCAVANGYDCALCDDDLLLLPEARDALHAWEAEHAPSAAPVDIADSCGGCGEHKHEATDYCAGEPPTCPKCGGTMHTCETGDDGCYHCDANGCTGAVRR